MLAILGPLLSRFIASARSLAMHQFRWTFNQLAPALVVLGGVIAITAFVLWGPPHALSSAQWSSWQAVFNIGALILFLSLIIAVIPVARHDIDSDNAFVAGLVATAALVPTTVTEIGTVAAYIAVSPPSPTSRAHVPWVIWVHNLALAIGVLAGLLAWAVWAAFYRHLVTPNWQNTRVFAQLAQRTTELRAAYDSLAGSATNPEAQTTLQMIHGHLEFMERELGPPGGRCGRCGLRWVLATGYLNLWQHLHKAEEALILVKSTDSVVRDALFDVQRLQGSTIPGASQLSVLLRHGASILSPASTWYFSHIPLPQTAPLPGSNPVGAPVTAVQDPGGSDLQAASRLATATAPSSEIAGIYGNGKGTAEAAEQRQARSAIFEVRCIINDFRDARWDALVRRRNHLLEAVIFTRITAYGLLGLAILNGVQASTILAVTVFYLVGALVGLFNRLQLIGASGMAVEDYGLSTAVLTEIAPFSGLAAVGGVIITGLLGVALTHSGTTGSMDLGSIFNLRTDQFGIVVAAVFGLTPNLLTSNLQKVSDQYKTDLKSTATSTGS